jgi:hypothetical protein
MMAATEKGAQTRSVAAKVVTAVHLDTSLQIERCKAGRKAKPIVSFLRDFRFVSTSSYAKLEFKRAWLQRLAYLYSLSGQVKTIGELSGVLADKLGSHPLHRRQLSTCLQAIEAFLLPTNDKISEAVQLTRMRAHLRVAVLNAYSWWEASVTHEYNGTNCIRASERPRISGGGKLDVSIPKCRRNAIRCRIHSFLQDNREHLRAIKAEIDRLGSNASDELKGARAVLDIFEDDAEKMCQDDICVKLGDILVAIDGINIESFAANNDKEWVPLARALQKHLLNPLRLQNCESLQQPGG